MTASWVRYHSNNLGRDPTTDRHNGFSFEVKQRRTTQAEQNTTNEKCWKQKSPETMLREKGKGSIRLSERLCGC